MELWVIHPKLNTVNPTCLNTRFLSAANFDSTLFKFFPKTIKRITLIKLESTKNAIAKYCNTSPLILWESLIVKWCY